MRKITHRIRMLPARGRRRHDNLTRPRFALSDHAIDHLVHVADAHLRVASIVDDAGARCVQAGLHVRQVSKILSEHVGELAKHIFAVAG